MNLSENLTEGVDPELRNFLEIEVQKNRYKLLVHELTDRCWDLCIGKIKSEIDHSKENCLTNCVERFIDTTNFIVNRLDKTQSSNANQSSLLLE